MVVESAQNFMEDMTKKWGIMAKGSLTKKDMTIQKSDLATIIFLFLVFGWILGRFTEAIALGNIF